MHPIGVTTSVDRRLPASSRTLVIAVCLWVPAELAILTGAAARRGHAELLLGAGAIDAIILTALALVLVARARGGWTRLEVSPARVARLALSFLVAGLFLARLLRVPVPSAARGLVIVGELAVLAWVAARAGRLRAAVPTHLAGILDGELALVAAAVRALRRRPLPLDPSLHTTSRTTELGRIYAALAILTVAELPALHLLLHASSWKLHAVLVALHVYSLLWILGDLRLLRESGHRVLADRVELRLGFRWRATIDRARIVRVVTLAGAPGPRPDTLRLTPREAPNVLVELDAPIALRGPFGRQRTTRRLALRLDDAPRFLSAFD